MTAQHTLTTAKELPGTLLHHTKQRHGQDWCCPSYDRDHYALRALAMTHAAWSAPHHQCDSNFLSSHRRVFIQAGQSFCTVSINYLSGEDFEQSSSVDSKNPILLLHRATAELCWPRAWLPYSYKLLAMAIFGNSVGNIIVTAVITWTLQRRYVVFAMHHSTRHCSYQRRLLLQCCFGNQAVERVEMFHHYSSWCHIS